MKCEKGNMAMITLPLDRVEENGVLVVVVTVIGLAVVLVKVVFSSGSVQVTVLGLVRVVDVVILLKKRSRMHRLTEEV